MYPAARISINLPQPLRISTCSENFRPIAIGRFKLGAFDPDTSDIKVAFLQEKQRPDHIHTNALLGTLIHNSLRGSSGEAAPRTHDIPVVAGQMCEGVIDEHF